jgi:hypothetical protein
VAMSLDAASRLTVHGGVTSRGDVQIWGSRLDFRTATGGTDTDPMEIFRVTRATDNNDLRVVIGDDLGGGDRFVVGPVWSGDGQFKEQLVVLNNGDVRIGRDFQVGRDARIAQDLYVGNRKALIDVIVGQVVLNQTTSGSGTRSIFLISRLPRVTNAFIMVGLSDVANLGVAVNARWQVTPTVTQITAPNIVRFDIFWRVDDIDGRLTAFNYAAIFLP